MDNETNSFKHLDLSAGWLLTKEGFEFQAEGKFDKAVEKFNLALGISRKLGNKVLEGASLMNVGLLYPFIGQFEKALNSIKVAFDISRDMGKDSIKVLGMIGDSSNPAMSLMHMRAMKRHLETQRDEGRARELLDTASKASGHLKLAADKSTGEQQRVFLSILGLVQTITGQYDEAMSSQNDALLISLELGDLCSQCTDHCDLGNTDFFCVIAVNQRSSSSTKHSRLPGVTVTAVHTTRAPF